VVCLYEYLLVMAKPKKKRTAILKRAMTNIFNYNINRLHGLDHLRAVAIILVMIYHYHGNGVPTWLEPIKSIGWTGVDLFFVLSGYLIGYQLLKEYKNSLDINFKRFYFKRFFRIIPAYLAVLIMYYFIGDLHEGRGLPPLWKFLTFTQNYGLDYQHQSSFSHAWSLCVEEQFYLILPVTIILIFKSRLQKIAPYLLVGLIGVGLLIRFNTWNEFVQPFVENGDSRQMNIAFLEKIYYPSHNRMDGLIIGVTIASIFNFKPRLKEYLTKYGNIVLIIGIVLLLLAFQICNSNMYNSTIYGIPSVSLAYGIILISAISPTCILYKLKSRLTLIIATLSYAIYLTHKQLYQFVKTILQGIDNEFLQQYTFWICIVIALIGGLILHIVIEKPFLRLRDKILIRTDTNLETKGRLILNYIKAIGNKKARP
jgi:peptidoglycan/LPS O-acetylase OafA/YrhL